MAGRKQVAPRSSWVCISPRNLVDACPLSPNHDREGIKVNCEDSARRVLQLCFGYLDNLSDHSRQQDGDQQSEDAIVYIVRAAPDSQPDNCDHQDGKDNDDQDQCPDGDTLCADERVHDRRVLDREGPVEGLEAVEEEEQHEQDDAKDPVKKV